MIRRSLTIGSTCSPTLAVSAIVAPFFKVPVFAAAVMGLFAVSPALAQQAESPEARPLAPGVRVEAPSTTQAGKVDESALRYYARNRDFDRLEAEIRRLRQIHPDWQPPEDLLTSASGGDGVDDGPIWRLVGDGKVAEARAAVAEQQRRTPGWRPSRELLDALDLAETRARYIVASESGQWEEVIGLATGTAGLLGCATVDNLWRLAEAHAKLGQVERAFLVHRDIVATCPEAGERRATLYKAAEILAADKVRELIVLERTRASSEEDLRAVAEIEANLARGRMAQALGSPDLARTVSPEDAAEYEREVLSRSDADGATLLGWYHYNARRYPAAESWFLRARQWRDDEQAAEGLVLTYAALGRRSKALEAGQPYRGRSIRVDRALNTLAAASGRGTGSGGAAASDTATIQARRLADALARDDYGTCLQVLAEGRKAGLWNADLARQRGWCLLGLGRHTEADLAFDEALTLPPGSGGGVDGLKDNAFGRNIADLRAGRSAEVLRGLVAGSMTVEQTQEIRASALADQSVRAYREGRHRDALRFIGAHNQLAPARRDLEVIRGWSLHALGRRSEALEQFQALDRILSTAESREGLRVVRGGGD